MDSFLKQAAGQVSAAADKAAASAQARFGDNFADQIKKGGQMAADQVEHLDVNKVLTQTGLAEKAKAMGVSLPSGAAGSTPADPAAEKAAVAAAAPGIVKDAAGNMAKVPDGATSADKADAEKAASQAAPEMLSAVLGAVGMGGGAKGGAAQGAPAGAGCMPTTLAGAETFLKAQGPGLMSQAMGALKQGSAQGGASGGATGGGPGGPEGSLAAKAEQFAKSAAPGILSSFGFGGSGGGSAAAGAKPDTPAPAADAAKPAATTPPAADAK